MVKKGAAAVQELLAAGADTDLRTIHRQQAPLHLAAVAGCQEAAQLLVAAGADTEARCDKGGVSCVFAAQAGEVC